MTAPGGHPWMEIWSQATYTAIRRQPSPPTPATSSAIQPSPHESHKSHSACHVSSWQDVSARRCCRAAPAQICRPNATRSSTAFLAAIAARLWRRTLIVRACLPPAAAARAVMLSKATGRIRRFGAGNPLHRCIPDKMGGGAAASFLRGTHLFDAQRSAHSFPPSIFFAVRPFHPPLFPCKPARLDTAVCRVTAFLFSLAQLVRACGC